MDNSVKIVLGVALASMVYVLIKRTSNNDNGDISIENQLSSIMNNQPHVELYRDGEWLSYSTLNPQLSNLDRIYHGEEFSIWVDNDCILSYKGNSWPLVGNSWNVVVWIE